MKNFLMISQEEIGKMKVYVTDDGILQCRKDDCACEGDIFPFTTRRMTFVEMITQMAQH